MKHLLAAILVVYLLLVAAFTVLPTRISRVRGPHATHVNLVPLGYSFKCILRERRSQPQPTPSCLLNTLGNIVLFVPFGILLPLLSSRFRSLKRVAFSALCLSLSIEATQLISRYFGSLRAVDIDDLLLNTLGACLGFAVYRYGRRGQVSNKD